VNSKIGGKTVLKMSKKEGESFSNVVKRLAGERSWREVTGILSERDAEKLEKYVEERREQSRERSDHVADELDEYDD